MKAKQIIDDFQDKIKSQDIIIVTECILNNYLSDIFMKDLETEEDLFELNKAEDWLRHYYNLD